MEEHLLQVIRNAMDVERRGHAYYLEAARATSDRAGRKVFLSLAGDELDHLKCLSDAWSGYLRDGRWPAIPKSASFPAHGQHRLIFPDPGQARRDVQPLAGELAALERGLEAEHDSIRLYAHLVEDATEPEARALFQWLAGEEEGHRTILQGEHDYLTHAGFWFDIPEFSKEVE